MDEIKPEPLTATLGELASEALSTTMPLFPDEVSPHRYECWNCGKTGFYSSGSSWARHCACGCGWSVRFGIKDERAGLELRERVIARQIKMPVVDFSKPGAPSSPA